LYKVIYVGEIRFTIPKKLHKALRLKAVKEDKTLRNLIVELLEQMVKVDEGVDEDI